MDNSLHGATEDGLVWDEQAWNAFIAEVNQSVPARFDGQNNINAGHVDSQDVQMNGVVENWLYDSPAFRQPREPQIWQHPNSQAPFGSLNHRAFAENNAAPSPKTAEPLLVSQQPLSTTFRESVSGSTADGGPSRTFSVPSSQGDYPSATSTPDQQSRIESNPPSPRIATLRCHICSKQFMRSFNLRQHLRTHTTEKPHICQTCKRGFARSQDLKRHEAYHYDDLSTPNDSEGPVMSRQGSMTSMNSSISAASAPASGSGSGSNRRRGLRIPGGYPCPHCDRAFDVPTDLAQHERNHRPKDQRPHACTKCDERFLYPKDLNRHMQRKHKEPTDTKAADEALPSFESIERVDHISPSAASSSHRTQQSSPYQSADPLESLAEVITGIPPGLRNMLFASMQGDEQDLKVRLAKVWLGGIEVLLKTRAQSDEQSQRTNQALNQLALDLERLEVQGD